MKTIEKIIQSSTTPNKTNVIWVDISNIEYPLIKSYINGEWKVMSDESSAVVIATLDEIDALFNGGYYYNNYGIGTFDI